MSKLLSTLLGLVVFQACANPHLALVHPEASFSLMEQSEAFVPAAAISQEPQLHLQAIMMIDDDNWTVWVNGVRIGAKQSPAFLTVHSVSADGIEATWHEAGWDQRVRLGLNQRVTRSEVQTAAVQDNQTSKRALG
ncbi:MAG: hypothetical protein ACPGXY_02250 [Alphaproteobacteria bacterium]